MITKLEQENKILYREIMYINFQEILVQVNERFIEHVEKYPQEDIPQQIVKNLINNCIDEIAILSIAKIIKMFS